MTNWKTLRNLAIGAVVFAGLGCAAGFDGALGPGIYGYTARLAGDVARSIGGESEFGSSQDATYGEVFVVAMELPGSDGIIALARKNTARPAAGEYVISDVTSNDIEELPQDEFFAYYLTGSGDALRAHLLGTGGTLTISASDARAVSGSFAFDAVGFEVDDPTSELTVRIAGSFTARAARSDVQARIAAALLGRGF